MAIKELRKNISSPVLHEEEKVKKFISQGGSLAEDQQITQDSEHRLTLRIPKWLVDKVDEHRKSRVGKISRNVWILEQLEKATQQ